MLKGHTTNERYEECLKEGFCKDHLKELEIKDEAEGYELQRKAMLYIRLQIFAPLLFNKPFSSEKMKTLFAKSKCFPDKNDKKKDFKEAIMVLDSVVVYTLCYFSKVCCAGILYQSRKVKQVHDAEKQRILELLSKKLLEESDIGHFNPILKENFTDFDKNLIKVSYVTALLYVRNVTMNLKLGEVLNRLNAELNSVSREGEKWKIIGNDSYIAKRYEEAVNAFSSAIMYNPYCVPLLKNRAQTYLRLKQYNSAALDYYIILVLNPMSIKSYYKLSYSLLYHHLYYESYLVVEFAMEKFKDRKQTNPKIFESFEKMRDLSERRLERSFPVACQMTHKQPLSSTSSSEVDIPDLIEASDSESETQDIPDLMDASDSEVSESEAVNEMESEEKESESPVPKAEKLESCFRNEKEEKRENLSWSLKEASCVLLDGCGLMAIPRFQEALHELKTHPEFYSYEECDILCIKYAYGCALCKSKEYDDLQKAINIFREVTEDHKKLMFPAAHYGIGLAYYKLNWFKDALVHLKAVKDILQKEIPFKVCTWPELNTVIEETNPENLKVIVDELIKECENPPPPDAVCRFDKCSLRASIYLNDPDFKGYYFIQCSEHCCLQYHPQCWKILRSLKQCTDKAFLEQKCFTPDCEGVIGKIQSVCKEGNVEKTFSLAETKKLAKQKRSKVGKKPELKEEKKRRRRDSTSKSESAEAPEEKSCNPLPEAEVNGYSKETKSSAKVGVNESNEDDPSSSLLSANAEPFIMLKKEKLVDEYASKASSKSKEHKKAKSNTIPIDEFFQRNETNDYSRRLNALREKNKSIIEGSWSNCNNKSVYQVGNSLPTSFEVSQTHHNPFETKSNNSLLPTPSITPNYAEISAENNDTNVAFYDPPMDITVIESVKKEVYSYLKNLLQKHGPLRIDDPILVDELKDFPPIANKVIADCDGVGGFLKRHLDFALVGDTYVCVVTDVVAAYKKLSVVNKLHSLPSYSAYSVADDVEGDEAFNSSCLNPSAEEYLPPTVESTTLSDENINRNSPVLISAISKLRQPLAVDAENISEKNKKARGTSQYQESFESRTRSSFSSDIVPKNSSPQEKVAALLEKFLDYVDIYYSEEMDQHRSYIEERMKPYRIVHISQKNNACIQTENTEVEKVSKGIMKTDEELEKVKEITCFLTRDKKELLQRIQVLEKERNTALSSVVKNQIESNTEYDNMKKELVDLKSVLDKQQSEFERTKETLVKENATLSEKLKVSEELNSNQKTALGEIISNNESMKGTLKHLQDFVGVLENEKKLMEKSVEMQHNKLKNTIKTLETQNLQVLERAKYAEHLLLHLKKSDYLRRIECKAAEAAMKMKQLQDGKSLMPGNPALIKNLEMLIAQMKEYIIKLNDIRKNFMVQIDKQINQVNNGTPLNEMQPIDTAELPEVPSWTNAALNAQSPCWPTPVQSIGSAYNTPSPAVTPSTTNLATKSETPNFQPDPLQRAPHQKPVDNSTVPPTSDNKLAPSVQNLFSAHSQTIVRPQAVSAIPKQPQTEVKSKSNLSDAAASKESLVSVAAASKESLVSVAAVSTAYPDDGKSGKNVASSSLELDYNVKKNDIKKTVSAAVSQESLQHEPKNCYEKLLRKLHLKFPEYTQPQLMDFVKEFRDQRNGKLSGLTMDSIINRVSLLIESKKEKSQLPDEGPKQRPTPPVLVNKKLVLNETKAKKPIIETNALKKCPWGKGDGDSSKQWSGNNIEDGCTICFEDMSKNAFRVDCGHCFHYKCIKEWLSKKSDCPICRVHLLLPDEYPALK